MENGGSKQGQPLSNTPDPTRIPSLLTVDHVLEGGAQAGRLIGQEALGDVGVGLVHNREGRVAHLVRVRGWELGVETSGVDRKGLSRPLSFAPQKGGSA